MLSQFQASYQRMEQSLQRLTDSIAAYNPSTVAADELVAADGAVDETLEQLVDHQRNHLRIEELKQSTAALDSSIRAQLQFIVDLRKELLAVPPHEPHDEQVAAISVDDLLAYAKHISQSTPAPRGSSNNPDAPPPSRPAAAGPDAPPPLPNGTAIPPAAAGPPRVGSGDDNVGVRGMAAWEKAWLDPLANVPREPWPSHELLQRGALGEIQRMIERGEDPGSVLSAEERERAARRREEEEEKERLELEARERRRMSMFDVGRRRTVVQDDVFDPDA